MFFEIKKNQTTYERMASNDQECCVCYSTTSDIAQKYKKSFMIIPCGGEHVVCFQCFMRNTSQKCPMCRFNYKTGQPEKTTIDSRNRETLRTTHERTISNINISRGINSSEETSFETLFNIMFN